MAWRVERSESRYGYVVHAISATVLRLVSGGPGGGDAGTATTARTPFFLCEERSGHSKAPQPCGTVVPSLSAAAGGGGLRYQVKGGPKRRAPESGERATCAGDVALRLQTNHSKQRFAAETAHLFPAALIALGASSGDAADRDAARARVARKDLA